MSGELFWNNLRVWKKRRRKSCNESGGKRAGAREVRLATMILLLLHLVFLLSGVAAKCSYEKVLLPEEWEHVEYYASFLDKTVLPTQHRKVCFGWYSRLAQEGLCLLSASDEQLGGKKEWYKRMIATIFVNSLPHLEKALGSDEVLSAYKILNLLAGDDESLLQWVKPTIPLLYGLPPFERNEADACSLPLTATKTFTSECDKKIYVYDNDIIRKYTRIRISTTAGQEGIEPLLHRWLENSACRTLDPEEADFFFVPFYHNGFQREAYDPPLEDSTEIMREAYHELIPSLEYFDSFRRRDHIFLFAHEFWGARELWHRDHASKAILLVVESNPLDMKLSPSDDMFLQREQGQVFARGRVGQLEVDVDSKSCSTSTSTGEGACNIDDHGGTKKGTGNAEDSRMDVAEVEEAFFSESFSPSKGAQSGNTTSRPPSYYTEHCLDCFDDRKDQILPQHIDHFAIQKFSHHNRPYHEREHLYCFRGSLQHRLYDETTTKYPFQDVSAGEIRATILKWAKNPKGSIGGHLTPVVEYYKRMGNCKFCLIPKGVGFTNGRLFESFFSGCIPVLLSDALRLPFEKTVLEWDNNLAIRFPTKHMEHLPKLLELLDSSDGKEKVNKDVVGHRHTTGDEVDAHADVVDTADPDTDTENSVAKWPSSVKALWIANRGRVSSFVDSLEKASCWINYYSQDPGCSPYQGMLLGLRRNRIRLQRD
ncbi:unnamed protein product [Amoebophrya sp. A25]|nr:unnamed protein product [Amoebophrya sp. A25]|eukprot:GSA25T00002681001.1